VANTYDLLLQAKNPGEPAPVAALVAALNARGATVNPEGRGTWKLTGGEVTVEPLFEEGIIKGVDLRVPLADSTTLLENTVKELVDLVALVDARLTDPQRGDSVTLTSLSSVVDEYLRMARYAGEYGGVSAALGLTSYAAPPESNSSTLRLLMIAGVFLVALWAGWRTIQAIREAANPPEPPPAVDGAPKVPRK
jgi:hypothetical protein